LVEVPVSKALVVCPATDELELIDYLDSPLGPLIHGCSRFRPATSLACRRACARSARTELEAAVGAAVDTGELVAAIDACDSDDTDVDVSPAPCACAASR
jgi:hypothetical protein